MYGLNAVALVLFGCVSVLAHALCKCPESTRNRALKGLCMALLTLNLLRYGFIFPFVRHRARIPVEFSSISFFAVPIIFLSGKRRARSWAAYSGLMAGFFYFMALILAGGPLYQAYPPREVYISMFCHGVVYLCSFVAITTESYAPQEAPKLAFGVALVAAWAALFRPVEYGRERLLIYILIDGACIKQLLPPRAWPTALPAYYLALAAAVLLSIKGFFKRNRKLLHGQRAKAQIL